MLLMTTHRPRNVNATRAAGILYGDWGTSKAYVIGLAFAVAGYAAFWPILAVSILSLFVGLNYVLICKYYPNGGGVYASVRQRSEGLAVIGAFFLVADYLVTAALSALSAFNYLEVSNPAVYSAIFIVVIACLNFFGPRHTGILAFVIAVVAVLLFTCLAFLSFPFLEKAWHQVSPLPKHPLTFWEQFCSVIVALSGVEAIANTTSVMRANRGTSKHPVVTHTSTPAILMVMFEVIIFTTLFGLAASAIGNFHIQDQTVSVPGYANVGDRMLTYLALVFGNDLLGSTVGTIFSNTLKIIIVLVLLSAVNTAINGLISLQYLMASDDELPKKFLAVNRYGVPFIPLLIAGLVPAVLILIFKKVIFLANLYAIGFVGAIATNLGATSTEKKLSLSAGERIFMFCTFLVMAAIEITLFIQKPDARYFVLAIIVIGLGLRTFAREMRKKRKYVTPKATQKAEEKAYLLCVIKKKGKALRVALQEAVQNNQPLNLVFVREQQVISERDLNLTGAQDKEAKKVLDYVHEEGIPNLVYFQYSVTDSFADIAIAYAERYGAERLIIDAPSSKLSLLRRGNVLRRLYKDLPEHTTLVAL